MHTDTDRSSQDPLYSKKLPRDVRTLMIKILEERSLDLTLASIGGFSESAGSSPQTQQAKLALLGYIRGQAGNSSKQALDSDEGYALVAAIRTLPELDRVELLAALAAVAPETKKQMPYPAQLIAVHYLEQDDSECSAEALLGLTKRSSSLTLRQHAVQALASSGRLDKLAELSLTDRHSATPRINEDFLGLANYTRVLQTLEHHQPTQQQAMASNLLGRICIVAQGVKSSEQAKHVDRFHALYVARSAASALCARWLAQRDQNALGVLYTNLKVQFPHGDAILLSNMTRAFFASRIYDLPENSRELRLQLLGTLTDIDGLFYNEKTSLQLTIEIVQSHSDLLTLAERTILRDFAHKLGQGSAQNDLRQLIRTRFSAPRSSSTRRYIESLKGLFQKR